MEVKKEILIKGEKAILTYSDTMLGKEPDELETSNMYANILLENTGINTNLYVYGQEYYDRDKDDYVPDFYFEVVDFDKDENELSFSETIYETASTESELIDLMTSYSSYLDSLAECSETKVL